MLLKSVEINNFKSIESCKIDIEKGCKVFVGLSESGKSNLLCALSCLDSGFNLTKEYIKAGTRSNQDSSVDFDLIMDSEEKKQLIDTIQSHIYSSKINKFIMFDGEQVKIEDFIKFNYLYSVDVRKNERNMKYYILSSIDKYEINDNHVFITGSNEAPITITNKKNSETTEIKEKVIVNLDEYDISTDDKREINAKELNTYFCSFGLQIAKNNIPSVLFWEYKDEYLLPSSILIKDFIENPDINIPLKYIFKLCEIDDIKSEYEECLEMGEASFQNLLDDVSKNINKYLRQVWRSMPTNCRLELKENADKINIRIKDSNNSYLLDKRSDGFKRLITYMIMVSVKNKNNQLNNTLILVDEPETKIDIPGQEYLKLELINISKNNYVFYSTHSTSMVDTSNIGRHYIVKKTDECTQIEEANEDNYDSALTLYKALGMQVYAVIRDKNIIFEGWTDMNIFKTALLKMPQGKRNKFKNIGMTHVPGATKFRDFASFWGLLARDYYIISDADETSSGLKEAFLQDNYTGTWYKYDEFNIPKQIFTCEDFIDVDYIVSCAKKFGDTNNFSTKINKEKLLDESISNVSCIEEWIRFHESDKKKSKKLIMDFKTMLASNIKKENIIDEYKALIDGIIEKLNL